MYHCVYHSLYHCVYHVCFIACILNFLYYWNNETKKIRCAVPTRIRRRATPPPPIQDGRRRRRTHYEARQTPSPPMPLRRESARRLDYFSLECLTSWFSAYIQAATASFVRTVAVRGQRHWLICIAHVFSFDRPDPPHARIRMPSRTPTNNLFQASLHLIEPGLHYCSKPNLNQNPSFISASVFGLWKARNYS